jgi:hypothetical protein
VVLCSKHVEAINRNKLKQTVHLVHLVGPVILIYYDAGQQNIKHYKLSCTLQLRITNLQGKNFVLFDRQRKTTCSYCMHLSQ